MSGIWGVMLAWVAFGAFPLVDSVAAGEAPVSELQGVVSEWIDLRSTISREQQDWDGEKARLKDYLAVLVRRRDGLAADLATNKAMRSTAADRVGELAQRRGELAAILAEFEPHLVRAEKAAAQWLALIPEAIGPEGFMLTSLAIFVAVPAIASPHLGNPIPVHQPSTATSPSISTLPTSRNAP